MAERLGMVIDMKGCVACASCAVACKVENNLPDGVWWNRILTDGGDNPDTPAGAYPNLTMENIAVACQHCENPACVKVCPVGATCWHRLAKGLQPACVEVCPGRVRFFGDFNDPESEVSRLLRERAHKQLLPERGTNPSVYYLV